MAVIIAYSRELGMGVMNIILFLFKTLTLYVINIEEPTTHSINGITSTCGGGETR